jgi:hypothetical protein
MKLQVETVDRVRAFWRAWEAQGNEPASVVDVGRQMAVRVRAFD